jgi:hypothetical protein
VTDLLIFLHVLAASAWIGAALWVAGDIRRTLALGKPHVDALVARVSPALKLDLALGAATLVTGLLVFMVEGKLAHRTGILIGLLLTLARIGLVAGALAPAWRQVAAAVARNDLAGAAAPAKRMTMLSGIAHTLWLGALAGMIFG